MYFGTPLFNGGHESAGVTRAGHGLVPRGRRDRHVLHDVRAGGESERQPTRRSRCTYLPAIGRAGRRRPCTVAGELALDGATSRPKIASLANAAVATRITSTQPVIAERAQVLAGHAAIVVRSAQQLRRHVARPSSGASPKAASAAANYQTYILLANPSTTTAANVKVTFLKTNGTTVVKDYTVQPTSRFNVEVHAFPELVERVVRRADRSAERRRHRGRAGDVFGFGRRDLGGGHERARHAAAVAGTA